MDNDCVLHQREARKTQDAVYALALAMALGSVYMRTLGCHNRGLDMHSETPHFFDKFHRRLQGPTRSPTVQSGRKSLADHSSDTN